MNKLVEESIALCHSNGRVHEDDVKLLISLMEYLREEPVIVQIGAGSCGAFAGAVLGKNHNAKFHSIEIHDDTDFHNWEQKFLDMYGYEGENYIPYKDASIAKREDIIDMVIINPCPDHSIESVEGMLKTWIPRLGNSGYFVVGSYEIYTEVSKTCLKWFGSVPDIKKGWSAVWIIGDAPKPKRKYNKRKNND